MCVTRDPYLCPQLRIIILGVSSVMIVVATMTRAHGKTSGQQGENEVTARQIEEVLKEHTEEWMSVPSVVGTARGLCRGSPCIKVYVLKKTPELEKKIPRSIEGFPVSIEETGEFRPLSGKRG